MIRPDRGYTNALKRRGISSDSTSWLPCFTVLVTAEKRFALEKDNNDTWWLIFWRISCNKEGFPPLAWWRRLVPSSYYTQNDGQEGFNDHDFDIEAKLTDLPHWRIGIVMHWMMSFGKVAYSFEEPSEICYSSTTESECKLQPKIKRSATKSRVNTSRSST